MTLPLFDMGERVVDPEDLGQWWTPEDVADRLVRWCGNIQPKRILEPSAGSGRLVAAARARWPKAHVEAHELHRATADELRARFARDEDVHVVRGDFLEAIEPFFRFDLAILNPPYEGGADGRFLSKAMDEADRVVALVRLAALAGQERHASVWSRVTCGQWHLAGVAVFASRPVFDSGAAIGARVDGGGAKADFCAVKLHRAGLGGVARTHFEWWAR